MYRVERPRGQYTRIATIAFLAMGAVSGVLWGLVSASSLGAPVAELPQIAALTFVLGALSLFATSRVGSSLQRRIRDGESAARWTRVATRSGLYGVVGMVLFSVLLLSNGVLYFALDRAWPISPADAGRIQFFVLAAVVLVPVAVALLALALLALALLAGSRIRPGAR